MRKARIYDARQLPAYLSPAQYAALMGVNLKTVQKMCRTGRLPAEKVGPRLWRIDKNAALEQGRWTEQTKSPPVRQHRRAARDDEFERLHHPDDTIKSEFLQ